MPSVKDFDKNKKNSEGSVIDLDTKKSRGARRRPGRDAEEAIAKAERIVADAEDILAEADAAVGLAGSADDVDSASEDTYSENMNENHEPPRGFVADEKKESPYKHLRVNVKGHEILNIETPDKVVEFVEAVVEEWKTDGTFNGLPLGHPIVQIAAAKGLRKAKDIEKKLEEKGVFAMAQMGLSIIKSKLKK
jgi:hypothetical protein